MQAECSRMVAALGAMVLSVVLLPGVAGGSMALAGEIALSFDDAPRGDGEIFTGEERTRRLIDALAEANAGPVVIFSTARGAVEPAGRRRLEAYAAAGHLIANHSFSHPFLERTDAEAFLADVQRAHEVLKDLPNFRQWFRYPYLREGETVEKRDTVRKGLAQMGYFNGYVTVDNFDWSMDRAVQRWLADGNRIDHQRLQAVYVEVLMECVTFYADMAIEGLGRAPRHVLLLHENDLAALHAGALVRALREAGWGIISPERAYEDPIAATVADVLGENPGRAAALAQAGGWQGPLSHPSLDEDYLENLLQERGVLLPGGP